MKKWSIIIGTAVIAVWLIVDTLREFFVNETIQYFSTEPVRLLYVAAIALGGGLTALVFDRLSPSSRRHVRVFTWGVAASTLTAFLAWFAFRLASLASLIVESGGTGWVLVALLLFSGIAAYLWFEFYRALKTGVSQ